MNTKFKPKGKWRDKLEKDQDLKIVDIPAKMQKQFGKGKMYEDGVSP